MPVFVIVYLEYRALPRSCWPALVERLDHRTIVCIDGRAPAADVLAWTREHLRLDERNYVRAACGFPPVGQPLPDDQVTNAPCAEVWPVVPVLAAPRPALRSA